MLLQQFKDRAVPFDLWRKHRTHVKVTYLYLLEEPLDRVVALMPEGIKAINAKNNVPDGPLMGYHETLTQAWIRLVYFTMCESGCEPSADAFFEKHPQLGSSKVLRFFYSVEQFTQPEAKYAYVEPDITPMPVSGKPLDTSNVKPE